MSEIDGPSASASQSGVLLPHLNADRWMLVRAQLQVLERLHALKCYGRAFAFLNTSELYTVSAWWQNMPDAAKYVTYCAREYVHVLDL